MDRFWKKVEIPEGSDLCWLWTAALDTTGYGRFYFEGRLRAAHHVAWFLEHGEYPPPGKDLDHQCHTLACEEGPRCSHRRCVNPNHLLPLSRSENLKRGHAGRHSRPRDTCRRGLHALNAPGADVYLRSDGGRECRPCRLERRRKRYALTGKS